MTMEDQLLEMLRTADDWKTAGDLAELGGWHPPHVGRALKNLGTRVVSRKSPSREGANGLPMIEYRHADAAIEQKMPTDKECCNAAKVVATTAGNDVAYLREQLADTEQVIANVRKAIGLEDGESIVFAIEKIKAENHELKRDRNAHRDDVLLWERSMMNLVGEDGIGSVANVVGKMKSDLSNAREQIAALNEQLMHGEEAVDVKDAARGYLVCAPKRKPAKLMKAESAVARAKAAAKSTGRSEVFALVPVGTATRKQIQAVEFKERAA